MIWDQIQDHLFMAESNMFFGKSVGLISSKICAGGANVFVLVNPLEHLI